MRALALSILGLVALASVGHGATGAMTFTHHAAPYGLPDAGQAGEPGIGVDWATGAVMYQAFHSTYLVTFDDLADPPVATWIDRSPTASVVNTDPLLFTDSQTGRTFAGGLDGACSVLSFTDDDGMSWTPVTNSCGGADHPSIAAGPWTTPPPVTARASQAVYYCGQSSFVQCAVSADGGLTFGPGVTVTCDFFNPGAHGSISVAPNGWVFVPFRTCGDVNGVAVSKDSGLTWTGRPIRSPNATHPELGFDPDVGVTTSSWAYVAYPREDHGVGVALTKDGGITWTDFGDVAAPAGVLTSTFHEMVAGDNDRAAVVYLGSDQDGEPHAQGFTGTWYLYVTYTLDAGKTWTTTRATENIVHRGWICSDGTTCQSHRNLLDFMDAQLDKTGRIVIGYADGCTGACELGYGPSIASYASIVRQASGPTMFAARDGGAVSPPMSMPIPPPLPTIATTT